MKKTYIFVTIIVLIIIIGLIGFFAYKNTQNNKQNNSTSTPTPTENQTSEKYFDENAKVMYFYSEYCHWCKEEKKVLVELAEQGYRVKPMDVQKYPEYWQKYSISGTPTFLAPDGTKKVGYQYKEILQKFLDQYK